LPGRLEFGRISAGILTGNVPEDLDNDRGSTDTMSGPESSRPFHDLDRAAWQRVAAVLDHALELPREQLAEYLDRACAADPALRAQVEALLAADRESDAFLDRSATELVPDLLDAAPPDGDAAPTPDAGLEGRRIGPWRVLHEVGRGGMGTVYRAERADGAFEQQVALKVVKRGLDTEEILQRFRQERQILARLEHPGIARLVDGGATEDGRPWVAMEYVAGEPLTSYCHSRSLGLRAVIALFQQVCRAVQYAHRNLVVHRDLKPGNILVTPDGVAKLLDFGIAKLLRPGESGELTSALELRMTPHYAAPEQVRGEPPTTATDVYALGVILYELLSGARPYRRPTASLKDLEHAILEEEPQPPSAAAGRGEPGQVAPRWRAALRGDLDDIVLMALRKEPDRRYPMAEAFADDLDRYLQGRPVRATRPTVRYRAAKFLRRNRVGVAAGAIVVAGLAAGMSAAWWGARVAAREARSAEAVRDFLIGLFQQAEPTRGSAGTMPVKDLLDLARRSVGTGLGREPETRAELLDVLGDIYAELGLYEQAKPVLLEALELRRRIDGPRHPRTADALASLADLHVDLHDFAEGLALHRQALAMRRAARPSDPLKIATSEGGVANALWRLGKVDSARASFESAMASLRRSRRVDTFEASTLLGLYANLQLEVGDDAAAESLATRALEIRQRLYGDDHLHTAAAKGLLAAVRAQQRRYEEGAALLREALATRRRLLGEDHPSVGRSWYNLGVVSSRSGRLAEAEECYEHTLRIYRQAFGPDDVDVAEALNAIATLRIRRGDYEDAEDLQRQALAIFVKRYGPDHARVAMTKRNLGNTRAERGEPGAEALLRDAVQTLERVHASGSPSLDEVRGALARYLLLAGRSAEARTLLERWLETAGRSGGAVLSNRSLHGACLCEAGRFVEAESLLQRSLTDLRADQPDSSWRVGEAELYLGECLERSGRPVEAMPHLQAGRAILGHDPSMRRLTRRANESLAAAR